MKKYLVTIKKTDTAYLDVEAETPEDAEARARELADTEPEDLSYVADTPLQFQVEDDGEVKED